MKRMLLVSFGYSHLAVRLDDSSKAAALIAALVDAVPVESKGYGDEQRYVPTVEQQVQLQFVDSERFTVGDEVATLKAQLAEARQQEKSYSGYWNSERVKTSKLEKELAELKKGPKDTDKQPPIVEPATPEKPDDIAF